MEISTFDKMVAGKVMVLLLLLLLYIYFIRWMCGIKSNVERTRWACGCFSKCLVNCKKKWRQFEAITLNPTQISSSSSILQSITSNSAPLASSEINHGRSSSSLLFYCERSGMPISTLFNCFRSFLLFASYVSSPMLSIFFFDSIEVWRNGEIEGTESSFHFIIQETYAQ